MGDSLRVQADDPAYQAMLRDEAAWWGAHSGPADDEDAAPNRAAVRCYNERYTGDPDRRWFDTIRDYGDFTSGLVIGAAGLVREALILETNPSLHLTFMDVSPAAVAQRERNLAERFPGRIQTLVADFNFLQLPEDRYDVIISSGVAHHIINLEHLAAQINRALTRDGYFFLEDYVGETKRIFAPEKKLAYELVYNRDMARQGRPPTSLEWIAASEQSSPFCSIRSADILDVFRAGLLEQTRHTAGALWIPLMHARDPRPASGLVPPGRFRSLRRFALRVRRRLRRRDPLAAADGFLGAAFVGDLFQVGDRLADAGEILPSNAFVVYRKRVTA